MKRTWQILAIFLGHFALSALAGGCQLAPLTATDADAQGPGIAAAGDVIGDAASAQFSDSQGDLAVPPGCDPPCSPWQTCGGVACAPKICSSDSQCAGNAGDPPHYCYRYTCQAFQCADDSDCPETKCNTLTYLCIVKKTGCSIDAECLDADACTDDTCDYKTGQCMHKLGYGCCKAAADCDDGLACTTEGCQGGYCTHTSKPNCCNASGECADSNACTTDSCKGGTCVFAPVAGCCVGDGACDDGAALSFDQCTKNQCIHKWPGMPGMCAAVGDCPGNACLSGACVAGVCSYTKSASAGCCGQDSECGASTKSCMIAKCSAGQCAQQAVSGVGTHVWQHLDSAALDGWSVQKDHPTVYFHFSTLAMISGAGALRYGVPGTISFESGNANKGSVTSPPLAVPAGQPGVQFWLYLDVEPGMAVHQCGLDVIDEATGTVTKEVWSKNKNLSGGTTSQQWKQQTVSLAPWAGKAVKLRFWFDQVKYDTSNKAKLGMVVDELVLVGACP